jgi:predicted short-subunit dehydrogenase-like oxidoreductase (DUF2520 family)
MTSVRIIGPGRAGQSFARALAAAGFEVRGVLGRRDEIAAAAAGVELLLLAVPDAAVAAVASAVAPVPETVVAHCSGALGLRELAPHERVASLHPLVTLPAPAIGGERLRSGVFFAVAGDPLAIDVVSALGGRVLEVPSQSRVRYHAAACIASNHLVALLGQVQRVAATAGLDLEAFLPLARGALEDVALLGPAAALTGPAARGDLVTVERHRLALEAAELAGYDAGVALACRLAASAGVPNVPLEPDAPSTPSVPSPPLRTPAMTVRRGRGSNPELLGTAGNGSWS